MTVQDLCNLLSDFNYIFRQLFIPEENGHILLKYYFCILNTVVEVSHSHFCCLTAVMVVVKVDGPTYLCKTDEVGELCVSSNYTGVKYWGLQGITSNTFQVGYQYARGFGTLALFVSSQLMLCWTSEN